MTEPGDPTELAGVAEMGTESVEAWSLADDLEEYPATGSWEDPERRQRLTPRRITALGITGSLLALAGAGGLAVYVTRNREAVPTTVVVVAAPTSTPPPVPSTQTSPSGHPGGGWTAPWPKRQPTATVTVTAPPTQMQKPPPQVQEPDEVNTEDAEFINRMRNDGWYIVNPWLMTDQARRFCRLIRQGSDPESLNQQIATTNGIDIGQALIFTSNAMLTYPGCRFDGGR